MSNPLQMIEIAAKATEFESRPADAAALLIDAAAMLACEAGPGTITELQARLARSHETLAAAQDVVLKTGAAAARKQ